ncbi:MAG: nuclear transport factor 2 family protein [bacterium]|nr:nuclear transport factor 2 family protein [bacterium]
MSEASISLQDRQAITDTLARYVWCMDTRNIEGVVAVFTQDGVVRDVTGKVWDKSTGGVRAFATHFLTLPERPVSQHWMQHMLVEDVGASAYRVTSYWALLALDAETGDKTFRSFGSYRDTSVNVNGVWLIKEKRIDAWKSEESR